MNYFVGNLPAAGYQWVTNSISFTATAQQANHNWIVLSTFPHGTSGMISNLCTSCGYNILNDCTVRLGNDTTLCLGDSYTLDVFRPNANYLWNNQSTSPTITVTQSGWYSVLVSDQICSDIDSIYIVFMDEFDLNQIIQPITCLEDSIVLSSPYPGANYLWFDGSTSQLNTVPDEGSYWVQTSTNNCQVTDTITLTDQLCFREIEMPNVFSPNGDGTNDLFLPLSYGGIIKTQMTIYNRWGKIVFSTSDLKSGWDGISLEGDMCAEGIYFWSINYTNKFRDTYKISGSVTLIRKP